MYNLRLNGNPTSFYQTEGKFILSMECITKASKASYIGDKECGKDIQYTSISEATW